MHRHSSNYKLFQVCLNSWLSDRSLVEGARCLRKDTTVEGGASFEQCVLLDQEDALHVRTCANSNVTSDLPEDVARLHVATLGKEYIGTISLLKASRRLDDEDVVFRALEVNVATDHDIAIKGVDTFRQSCAPDIAVFSWIRPVIVVVRASRGFVICQLHIADRCGQFLRSGNGVVRGVGRATAHDLCGRRKLVFRV
jgi:hypothetical protein